jgi:hypothetical protein
LIIGAVYKQLEEEMKLLWTKDLRINTVHVSDVVRAAWWVAATKAQGGGREEGAIGGPVIYNLADKGDTDQGMMNELIKDIFCISTGFQGTVLSSFAKMNLESVTEEVNDKVCGLEMLIGSIFNHGQMYARPILSRIHRLHHTSTRSYLKTMH